MPGLCQSSTVLRALLLVQGVLAIAVAFEVTQPWEWFLRYSVLTGGVMPATLVWLLLSCLLVRWTQTHHILSLQQLTLLSILLGGMSGWLAQAMLHTLTFTAQAHGLASVTSGAALAALVWAWLQARARQLGPSETLGRLQELQSRIRPHFLFNTLNSAIALVRAEPSKAEQVLEDLSELFRAAIGHTEPSSTLAQELELAKRYLAIEQIRFGDRLRVIWDLDPLADHAKLPVLILQPLVENAVRHGVEPSANGADIRIRTQRKATHVLIQIVNTLPSGTGTSGHGMALANVRERLQLMHDLESQFHHGLAQSEYVARIEVPA